MIVSLSGSGRGGASPQLPQDPVFVTGYPRSGTTLLLGLLLSQSGFRSLPETHYYCVVERNLLSADGRIPERRLDEALARITAKTEVCLGEEPLARLRQRAAERGIDSKELFELLVAHVISAQGVPDGDRFRWIEKTPNHANHLPRIQACYPRLQVVHLLRHPVPAILSRKLKFPFNRDTSLDVLAQRWNEMQDNVERFASAHPQALYRIRYEDLIDDPAGQMTALGRFLGFAYDPARGASWRVGLKPAILPSETWKHEDLAREWRNTNETYRSVIDRGQATAIEAITGEIMSRQGYRPFFPD